MAKLLVRLSLILLVFLIITGIAAFADVKSDFLSSNPNINGWEVGFLIDNGKFIAYNTTFDDGQGIAGWCLNNAPGPEGDVTINYTDQPIDRYGVHWEPGQICVHPPLRGEGVVVRWTTPDSVAISVKTHLIAQRPDTCPEVELWAGNTRLLNDKFMSSNNETSDVAVPVQYDTHDTLEKLLETSMMKGDKIKLIVRSCDKYLPSHVGIHMSITTTNSNEIALAKASFGADLPHSAKQNISDSSASTSPAQEVTSK